MSWDDWKIFLLLAILAGISIFVMVFSVRLLRKRYAEGNKVGWQAFWSWVLGTLVVFQLSAPIIARLLDPDWLIVLLVAIVWAALFALVFAFVIFIAVITLGAR